MQRFIWCVLLFMFIGVSSTFGHGQGLCLDAKSDSKWIKHFTPGSDNDPCTKYDSCDGNSQYKHGHKLINKQGYLVEWGYYNATGAELEAYNNYVWCLYVTPGDQPVDNDRTPYEPLNKKTDDISDIDKPPTNTNQPNNPTSNNRNDNPPRTNTEQPNRDDTTIHDVDSRSRTPHDTPEQTTEETIEEPEPEWVNWEYGYWLKGHNYISFPVMKPEIVTIADLFAAYRCFEAGKDEIRVMIEGEWYSYSGGDDEENQTAGAVVIAPYLGVDIVLDYSFWLGARGYRLLGDGSVEIKEGENMVGLTELPSRYTKPSDFLDIDGIESVTITYTDPYVLEAQRFFTIEAEGDSGDEYPLYIGQAVLIKASKDLTLDLTEPPPSAPSARNRLTLTWGALKKGK